MIGKEKAKVSTDIADTQFRTPSAEMGIAGKLSHVSHTAHPD